jgi:hypothetical protein
VLAGMEDERMLISTVPTTVTGGGLGGGVGGSGGSHPRATTTTINNIGGQVNVFVDILIAVFNFNLI